MYPQGRSRIIDVTPKPRALGPLMAAGGIIGIGLLVCGVAWVIAFGLWRDERAAAQCRSPRAAFEAVQDQIKPGAYVATLAALPPYGHPGMRIARVKGRACTLQVESHVILMNSAGERYVEPFTARASFDKAEHRWMIDTY